MCKLVQLNEDKYVADIKLHHIQNIVVQAKKAKNIERIILFGSSVEERCTKLSDIDIAVFGTKAKGKYLDSREFVAFHDGLYQFDWEQDYDVLYFQEGTHREDSIMADISHGVEIYRREPV